MVPTVEDDKPDANSEKANTQLLQPQDDECHDGRQDTAPKQRDVEEQLEANGRAQELRQVGRHSHDLGQDPHA